MSAFPFQACVKPDFDLILESGDLCSLLILEFTDLKLDSLHVWEVVPNRGKLGIELLLICFLALVESFHMVRASLLLVLKTFDRGLLGLKLPDDSFVSRLKLLLPKSFSLTLYFSPHAFYRVELV